MVRTACMKLPVQIEFRDLEPLPSLEGEIRQRVANLEKFVPELTSCRVTIAAEGHRHRQGVRYEVRLDVRLPGGELVTGEHQGDEQLEVALRGSFDAMTRKLGDFQRRRRGQVKQHATGRSEESGRS